MHLLTRGVVLITLTAIYFYLQAHDAHYILCRRGPRQTDPPSTARRSIPDPRARGDEPLPTPRTATVARTENENGICPEKTRPSVSRCLLWGRAANAYATHLSRSRNGLDHYPPPPPVEGCSEESYIVFNNNILSYTSRHIIRICDALVVVICGEGTPRGDAPELCSNRTRSRRQGSQTNNVVSSLDLHCGRWQVGSDVVLWWCNGRRTEDDYTAHESRCTSPLFPSFHRRVAVLRRGRL